AYLTPDATHEEVETIIKDEINTLIGGGVTEEELQRAKSVIRANIVYGRDGPFSIASQINEAIAMGDWTSYVNRPKQIEAVTSEDIRTAAERYFTDKASTTGWFIPEAKNILAMNKPRMPGPNFYRDPDIFEPYQNKPESAEEESLTALVNFSSTVRKEKVAGIEVVTIDMPIESVVSFAGSFAAGEALSPSEHPMLASLTAAMLDKGTTEKDRFAIAELLDTLGSDIAFSSESHSLSFSGRFLRPDAGAVLALLAEQLRTPAFESEVFETVRSRQEANLLMAVDDPTYRGSSEISRMLYPVGHPNREEELGILIEDLKRTNVEDLRKFHREHYGPESMRLVFAGDIDFEQIKAAVANAFEGWTGGVAYPEGQLEQFENRSEEEGIFIEDKTSVSVHYAYNTGLQRIDEDYLPFMIGNYILGGSFGARLMTEVRKNRGLTYDIRSFHQGDIMTPGNWVLRASFSPNMLDSGLEATEEVLDKWYTDGVSDEEVERAIETLTGSYLVGLSTTHRVAQQMHSFLQRELGTDYIDKYPLILRKISAPSVNRAIKKHLNPAQIRLVIAGSLENENAATSAPKDRSVSVRIDTPHPGWKIRIEKIFRAKDSLIVVSRLSESGGIAAQVITAVADKVEMPLDAEIPVRHYVLGKTWNWGGTGDYTFIDSMDKIGTALNNAELIYSR
ncbi:MAG: M16 family metallopeptidase, partial [Opitutales bacterium]